MSGDETPRLRGFDSYKVRLGDEMRGERASLGKSLLDVQRDLRIKAAHIDALENANPGALPYPGFVSAYLRTYARYLGMDENEVMRRFCEESGFDPANPAGVARGAARVGAARSARREDLDAVIAGSRLAAVSRSEAMSGRFDSTLRGVGSLAMLGALVWGVGFGGWALLQNIQRVEFAPTPDAPAALAEAPDFSVMTRIVRAGGPALPAIDADALAAVYAAQEVAPPRVVQRDGPIAALNPSDVGLYARSPATQSRAAAAFAGEGGLAGAAEGADAHAAAEAVEQAADPHEPAVEGAALALVFSEEAWVRVRDAAGVTVHEALMRAGSRWDAPADAEGLVLRAGNAGGVYVEIGGVLYGPLGARGAVAGRVALEPAVLVDALPKADAEVLGVSALVATTLTRAAP
ncbi:MAG: helix-turn-helix domain-containing protein [Rhodobacteraceae bacterium]|nr:MAG: helix-turn-helix domain-containing protein [Paracoccaceae bacterium]